MATDMTSLDEETPGRACEECSADLSNISSDARFCPFCSAELEVEDEDENDFLDPDGDGVEDETLSEDEDGDGVEDES